MELYRNRKIHVEFRSEKVNTHEKLVSWKLLHMEVKAIKNYLINISEKDVDCYNSEMPESMYMCDCVRPLQQN